MFPFNTQPSHSVALCASVETDSLPWVAFHRSLITNWLAHWLTNCLTIQLNQRGRIRGCWQSLLLPENQSHCTLEVDWDGGWEYVPLQANSSLPTWDAICRKGNLFVRLINWERLRHLIRVFLWMTGQQSPPTSHGACIHVNIDPIISFTCGFLIKINCSTEYLKWEVTN
jgi:hypothetical protein